MRRSNSYSPRAAVPAVGTRWVWEIDKPHAREIVEVVAVWWNGEEWWVRTRPLHTHHTPPSAVRDAVESPNDLGRFSEAVTPIGPSRGRWIRWTPDRPTEFYLLTPGGTRREPSRLPGPPDRPDRQ